MRIVSLNAWGGALWQPLSNFLRQEASSTDVFCLQESYRGSPETFGGGARLDFHDQVAALLPGFTGTFVPVCRQLSGEFGLSLFVREALMPVFDSQFVVGTYGEIGPVLESGRRNVPVVLQNVHMAGLTVAHFHGVAYPGHKLDTTERLMQSEALAQSVRTSAVPVILCGDLNLQPDTKSIRLLEQIPLRNLIAEFGIQSTRPEHHLEHYPPEERQYFADYMFVSPEVAVRSFEVPTIDVSDHLPLILETE
jgi:endonuclease/exonuclease/phosphatase (EEP) superfamily protein YafD